MKTKNLLKLIVFLLILIGCFVSCEKKGKFPVEISFKEYSLERTSCQWKNFEYDYSKPDILIIHSNEELENYIDCSDGTYPKIDFSKQTLIIAWGVAYNGIHNIEKQLIQTGNNQYNLSISIELNGLEHEEKWTIPIVMNKLSKKDKVTLSTEYINNF